MCGIAGIFERRGQQIDRALLDRMTDRLIHRGPDGRGTYVHGGVGFGHRRLAIIGVSDGFQPMCNEDGTLWVTYNGEIYNYLELKAELSGLGHHFKSRSDTEVLLHGYEAWGEALAERLVGIFAFVLHDQRTGRVFAVRDRLGVKPLYYHLSPERFVFASEAKALLLHPAVPRRPDLDTLSLYLRYGYSPAPYTAFAGVSQLPPASTLLVEGEQEREARYWSPPAPGTGVDGPIAPALDALIDTAVDSELMSEVPLGAFLSGGVDSSTVVAAMARSTKLGERPRTFCVGFEEAAYDESPHSRAVAQALSLDHHVEILRQKDLALLDRLVEVYDEPFADSSAIPTYALCQMARRHVTVALSGDGGDEIFAGYRRYQKIAAYPLLPPLARRAAARAARVYPARMRGAGRLAMMGASRAQQYERELSFPVAELEGVVAPDLLHRRPIFSLAELFERAPGQTAVERAQWVDLMSYLPGDILVKVDRASMAHALEVRVPLLDHRVVEWALRLPSSESFGGGEGKVALKAHLARRVPRELFTRPKMGFGVPLEFWVEGAGGLAGLAERLRTQRSDRRFRAPIDGAAFDRLLGRRGRGDASQLLWSLLFLEAWWQRHF